MAKGCRDCKRCTEVAAASLMLVLLRIPWWLLTFWNIGLFQKKCPTCGHKMSLHERRADGSFKD
jgi:hypothetical protein